MIASAGIGVSPDGKFHTFRWIRKTVGGCLSSCLLDVEDHCLAHPVGRPGPPWHAPEPSQCRFHARLARAGLRNAAGAGRHCRVHSCAGTALIAKGGSIANFKKRFLTPSPPALPSKPLTNKGCRFEPNVAPSCLIGPRAAESEPRQSASYSDRFASYSDRSASYSSRSAGYSDRFAASVAEKLFRREHLRCSGGL